MIYLLIVSIDFTSKTLFRGIVLFTSKSKRYHESDKLIVAVQIIMVKKRCLGQKQSCGQFNFLPLFWSSALDGDKTNEIVNTDSLHRISGLAPKDMRNSGVWKTAVFLK